MGRPPRRAPMMISMVLFLLCTALPQLARASDAGDRFALHDGGRWRARMITRVEKNGPGWAVGLGICATVQAVDLVAMSLRAPYSTSVSLGNIGCWLTIAAGYSANRMKLSLLTHKNRAGVERAARGHAGLLAGLAMFTWTLSPFVIVFAGGFVSPAIAHAYVGFAISLTTVAVMMTALSIEARHGFVPRVRGPRGRPLPQLVAAGPAGLALRF